ncbi:MAG TPA: hypothetical protein PLB32_13955, partial [Acidobacteriota bacterium]|nr:hypothetical protein [Acidobacteriota bacterium]
MSDQSLEIQKNWLTTHNLRLAARSVLQFCLGCLLLCFTVSCKDGARLPVESDQPTSLHNQVERGEVSVDGIVLTTNPEQTIYGRNIDFKITNQTDHPIAVAIETGTVLRSDNQQYYTNLVVSSGEQALI